MILDLDTIMFLLLAGFAVLVYSSTYIVAPGHRLVMWKRFGPDVNARGVTIVESGIHFFNLFTWTCLGQGPFQNLMPKSFPSQACPTPTSIVSLDPDRIEIMSRDGIPGTANVFLELEILPWQGSDFVGVTVPFRTQACIAVNQWVSQQLSEFEAKDLCSYATVVSVLNSNLAKLNESELLRECFVKVRRISLDPNGMVMHSKYAETVAQEITKRRALQLAKLDGEVAQAELERKLKLETLQAETTRAITQAKQEQVIVQSKAFLDLGFTPQQVGNLLVAEIGVNGVSKADKLFVGLPQSLLGLHGVDHVWEKV